MVPARRHGALDDGRESPLWREFLAQRPARGGDGRELSIDRAVAELARRQHGIVTTRQLAAAGIGHNGVKVRVRDGTLVRRHRGVYQFGPIAAHLGREMAALLALGGDAALSHHTAAALWKIRPAHGGPIHVTVIRERTPSHQGIRVHRSSSLQAAVKQGLRLTTPARTLLDLATQLPQDELERAVEQAIVRLLTTDSEIAARCEPGRRGAAKLRQALLIEPGLTRSEAERRLRRLVRAARLPRPASNTRVAGWEVDLLWREQRLVVEVDGFAFHGSRHAFERDRRRDADLVAAGYRVVRFTWRQIKHEPEAVVARLAVLLHAPVAIAA